MKMISLNTKMVAMNGCAVLMEANIATDVPTRLVDAAIASGCIPADSYTPTKAVVVEVEEEDSRGDAITDAINTLVGLADPADLQRRINKASARVMATLEKLSNPNQFDEAPSSN